MIVAILLEFLDKTKNSNLKKKVWQGTFTGVFASFIFGIILIGVSSFIDGETGEKLWANIASFIAVVLITAFIIWMIKHGSTIKHHIENKAALNLSKKGIFLIALVMIAREGVEIAIFQFAGKYQILPIILGVTLSIGIVMLIHHSLVKIKLRTIFTITLIYLILQAGFLIGNSIHEGLSASQELGIISENSSIFTKAFDLSGTQFNHEGGIIGIPLYAIFGWHSKPEWIQFIIQYGYTLLLLGYWYRIKNKR